MRVVICGGGVIGACTAYYLGLRGVETVVVERTGVACAASGKSGGFLALDWCDHTPLEPLARRSFALHAELNARMGDRWGYHRLDTFSVLASTRHDLGGRRRPDAPAWLGERAVLHEQLGTRATTAQIDPARFTRAMMDAALAQGAQLRLGRVGGVTLAPDGGAVTGVLVDGEALAADAVVIAMGPWSVLGCAWLSLPAVHGLRGDSILLGTDAPVLADALFVEIGDDDGRVHTPELFPRADGTIYLCGLSSERPLPEDPARVAPDPEACARLRAVARHLAPALGSADLLATQACYRPVTQDGLPLMGRVPGLPNAYVATGHSVWGMLNAPASGEAMAELILTGETRAVDLSPFDPARLPPHRLERR